jgi:hypothetical protein
MRGICKHYLPCKGSAERISDIGGLRTGYKHGNVQSGSTIPRIWEAISRYERWVNSSRSWSRQVPARTGLSVKWTRQVPARTGLSVKWTRLENYLRRNTPSRPISSLYNSNCKDIFPNIFR